MPYIPKISREYLDNGAFADTAGALNYQITKLVDDYVADSGLSYAVINEVIGVLECAKLEAYRRIAAPYERQKCAENGDVYTTALPRKEKKNGKN